MANRVSLSFLARGPDDSARSRFTPSRQRKASLGQQDHTTQGPRATLCTLRMLGPTFVEVTDEYGKTTRYRETTELPEGPVSSVTRCVIVLPAVPDPALLQALLTVAGVQSLGPTTVASPPTAPRAFPAAIRSKGRGSRAVKP